MMVNKLNVGEATRLRALYIGKNAITLEQNSLALISRGIECFSATSLDETFSDSEEKFDVIFIEIDITDAINIAKLALRKRIAHDKGQYTYVCINAITQSNCDASVQSLVDEIMPFTHFTDNIEFRILTIKKIHSISDFLSSQIKANKAVFKHWIHEQISPLLCISSILVDYPKCSKPIEEQLERLKQSLNLLNSWLSLSEQSSQCIGALNIKQLLESVIHNSAPIFGAIKMTLKNDEYSQTGNVPAIKLLVSIILKQCTENKDKKSSITLYGSNIANFYEVKISYIGRPLPISWIHSLNSSDTHSQFRKKSFEAILLNNISQKYHFEVYGLNLPNCVTQWTIRF